MKQGFRVLLSTQLLSAIILFFIAAHVLAACDDLVAQAVDWNGCDKSGVNLEGANLDGAKLDRTLFANSNLKSASLRKIETYNMDFTNANLEGATLEFDDVSELEFSGANLRNAELKVDDCHIISLEKSDARGATILIDRFRELPSLKEAQLEGAIFNRVRCAKGSVGECKDLIPPGKKPDMLDPSVFRGGYPIADKWPDEIIDSLKKCRPTPNEDEYCRLQMQVDMNGDGICEQVCQKLGHAPYLPNVYSVELRYGLVGQERLMGESADAVEYKELTHRLGGPWFLERYNGYPQIEIIKRTASGNVQRILYRAMNKGRTVRNQLIKAGGEVVYSAGFKHGSSAGGNSSFNAYRIDIFVPNPEMTRFVYAGTDYPYGRYDPNIDYYKIGIGFYREKHYKEAVDALWWALDQATNPVPVLNDLALALSKLDLISESRLLSDRVLRLPSATKSQKAAAAFNAGLALESDSPEKAIDYFEQAVSLQPDKDRREALERLRIRLEKQG